MEKETNINWERFFVHHTHVPTVKGVEFVSNMVSYIVMRGHWCNITVLNVHAQVRRKVMIQKAVFMRN